MKRVVTAFLQMIDTCRRQPLAGHRFEWLHRLLVVRRTQVLDIGCPRREPCTICTAVAPDPVRTVRTYRRTPRTTRSI
jgi:hypothetical protein